MKHAVITYIFGKNQELLREPKVIDDVEYICITDQKDLKSKVWKIVYDPMPEIESLRDKVALVKFNPFKYTDADEILIQDSSLQIYSSVKPLFELLKNNDILLKKHPEVSDLNTELWRWVKMRKMPKCQVAKFEKMAEIDSVCLNKIPVYECCLLCIKNDEITKNLFALLLTLMKLLGDGHNMIMTQQCTFSYLLETGKLNMKIGLINQHNYFIRFWHNCNKVYNK